MRAIRCIGFVLLGIGRMAVTVVAFAVAAVATFLLSAVTVWWFGLPVQYTTVFFVGYLIIFAGTAEGVALCRRF